MQPLAISHYAMVNSLGRTAESVVSALRAKRSGLAPCGFETVTLDTWIGQVAGLDEACVRDDLAAYACRNNALAQTGLEADGYAGAVAAARGKYGPERIGVFMGTSTSGMLQTELAYRRRDPVTGALPADFRYAETQNNFSLADFVQRYLGLTGPAFVISSACSSSAKVFGHAARMIAAGVCDAAVVGGVDTLCLTTLYGFHSLGLTSRAPCRPFAFDRDGISVGEGAGFALLEKTSNAPAARALLLGVGESCDAYHMSTPHPQGAGAKLAMQQALAGAGLAPADIDYVNLHGTATKANDASEDQAVFELFGGATPVSSTKGSTGHLLGAAGITEALISVLAIEQGFMPGGMHTLTVDPALRTQYLTDNLEAPVSTGTQQFIWLWRQQLQPGFRQGRLMRVFVEGIGLVGPGLDGWEASRALLAGTAAYAPRPTVVVASDLLPAAERRRTGLPVKLALAAGREAFIHAQRDAAATATVFTSSSGDGENLHYICTTLASTERDISPTRFHNSVHNAPAGYWSIATRAQAPSTSLCCHDASFAAGLLDAAAQLVVEGKPVALITYDQSYPEPLNAVRPLSASFGMALVMTAEPTAHVFAALDIGYRPGANATPMTDSALERLRATVPAARCLPLLAALAHATPAAVELGYGEHHHLSIEVTPWQ